MHGLTFNRALVTAVLELHKDTTRRIAQFSEKVFTNEVKTYAELTTIEEDGVIYGVVYYPSTRKELTEAQAQEEIKTHRLGHTVEYFDAARRWFVVEKLRCPYHVGQTFYLREDFWQNAHFPFAVYAATPCICVANDQPGATRPRVINFRMATGALMAQDAEIAAYLDKSPDWVGKPSRSLPEHLARCVLHVKSVELRRLKYIEGDDFRREGILNVRGGFSWHQWTWDKRKPQLFPTPLLAFEDCWNTFHGKHTPKPCPFESNPPVWVVRFTAVPTPVSAKAPEFAGGWFPSLSDRALPMLGGDDA